jgi:hypothetical protein
MSRNTFYILIVLYLCVIAFDIFLFSNDVMRGGDYYTYSYYTRGLHMGRYSYWYFLDEYIPDTFRNPGFGYIIYLLSFISDSPLTLVIVNLFAFLGAIYLLCRIVDKLNLTKEYTIKNILMLLMLLNAHLPFYINLYFPEVIMFFLLTLIVYVDLYFPKNKLYTYILLGLLFGIAFQLRSVIIFYPFIRFVLFAFFEKKNFPLVKNIVLLLVYVGSMMPYAYWNYKQNKVFSVTSLEGGGGVMHLGYWGFKMPDYLETRYWRNVVMKDLIAFTPDKDVPENIKAFNREWDYIDSSCAKYLTDKDRRNLPLMRMHPDLFVTYNGIYTYERDKLLKKLTFQHFIDDPVFSLKVKAYTFFRVWITGIKRKTFKQHSAFAIFKGIAPGVVTGFTFFLAMIVISIAMVRRKFNWPVYFPVLIFALYYGSIHILFAIQARYSVPVRPLLMMLTAICIFELCFRDKRSESSEPSIN